MRFLPPLDLNQKLNHVSVATVAHLMMAGRFSQIG